jgi:murein L,D-transpeptidase YafK
MFRKILVNFLPLLAIASSVGMAAPKQELQSLAAPELTDDLPLADMVLVKKSERKLYLLRDDQPFREYRIALGGNPVGHKQYEGDQRTPEGDYTIDWRNPNSAFHLSLRISYPNEDDIARAAELGVSPGSMIMIHGQPNKFSWGNWVRRWDWTDGCIAVANDEMAEIWRAVPDGTPIRIKP